MKIRSLLTLVGLAIGFAVPALAQEESTVDPKVRQEIEAVHKMYCEAHDKNDATAIAALFTQDAIQVTGWSGVNSISGQQEIQKFYAFNPAPSPYAGKLLQVYAIGNEIAAISEWTAGNLKGYKMWVFVRDGNTSKIRMLYATSAPRVW